MWFHERIRDKTLRLGMALGMALGVAGSARAVEPLTLRIGVPHVSPPPDLPAARLYTEDGFETEFATEMGRRLGRKVTLVAVEAEAAVVALAEGRIDALVERQAKGPLATGDLEVIASGYESGLSVAMRSDTDIRSWEALAGRTVCVVASNARARRLVHALGAREIIEPVPALTLMRVRTGDCDAALHDEAVLRRLFGEKEWTKFSATLTPRDSSRLVVILPGAAEPRAATLRQTVAALSEPEAWRKRIDQWAQNVALEVYLEQDAPDCH